MIKAAGSTLPELLEDMSRRLFLSWIDSEEVGETLREKVGFEAPDPLGLAQEWARTLYNLVQVQRLLPKTCHITLQQEKGHWRAQAVILGEPYDPLRHFLQKMRPITRISISEGPKKLSAEIHF